MGFSSRHAIATHILLVLGCCPGQRVCSDELAGSVNTNAVVIRRLISRLKEQGLVNVSKGKEGGYSLARDLKEITLWDVFEAVEDPPLFGIHGSPPNQDCAVGHCIENLLADMYGRAEEALKESLSAVTIQCMADCVAKK
jgi:Rrf2 family protein